MIILNLISSGIIHRVHLATILGSSEADDNIREMKNNYLGHGWTISPFQNLFVLLRTLKSTFIYV